MPPPSCRDDQPIYSSRTATGIWHTDAGKLAGVLIFRAQFTGVQQFAAFVDDLFGLCHAGGLLPDGSIAV
jgi:hypothetical protein